MIVSANKCWASAQAEYVLYFDDVVTKRVKRFESQLTKKVYAFLVANHNSIRDGDEADFRRIQGDFDKLYASFAGSTQARIKRLLPKIFNYSSFSSKEAKHFSAYDLCKSLDVLTCPYCNLSYGHTLSVGSDNILRPTLDHFFDKATYPLFAISLGNLVASCYHCNSNLKGSIDFFRKPHVHPHQVTEPLTFGLGVDLVKARHDLTLIDTADIELSFDKNDVRASNSVSTFYIAERYQLLIDEARFIAKNMLMYSSMAPDNVRLEWLKRGVSKNNYRNRVLGKLILDFSDKYLVSVP